MKSVPVVAFDYRPSRILAGALAFGCALALTSLFLSGLPIAAQLVCGVLAIGYVVVAIRRVHRDAPTRAVWQSAGHWRLIDAQGSERGAELRNATVRGEWLVLNLRRSDGGAFHLILLPDNSTSEVRRQLRVRLSRGQSPAHA